MEAVISLDASEHFVRYDRLPQVEESQSLRRAFTALSNSASGSLIVSAGAFPRWYVVGKWLKDAYHLLVQEQAGEGPGGSPDSLPIGSLLSSQGQSAYKVLGSLAWNDNGAYPRQGPIVVSGPVFLGDDPDRLTKGPDAVFLVVDDSRRPVGWFLNHESILASVNTPAPVFICVNGHSNPDPDSGHCYSCPGQITS